jgi:hypothetical protein
MKRARPMREFPQKEEGGGLIFRNVALSNPGSVGSASASRIKRASELESPEARPPDATGRRIVRRVVARPIA